MLSREEQRLVWSGRGGCADRLRMVLRACEYPFVEARKSPGHSGDSNVAKNLSSFYSLSAQVVITLRSGFLKAVSYNLGFFSIYGNAVSSNNRSILLLGMSLALEKFDPC
jgi:hypothetical protein